MRAEMLTGFSEESIKMQLKSQKMMDGRNLHPKLTIHLMYLSLLDPSIIIKNIALCLLKNEQGEYCNNPEDSLSILLNQFFPGHTEVPEVDTLEWVKVRNNKFDNTFYH